jgi:hypothetical protein
MIVVVRLASFSLFRAERNVEVVIEVGLQRRHPPELPIHSLADCLNLSNRCPGNCDVRHVVVLHVDQEAADMVYLQGASRALPILMRTHHEVLDEELASALEKIGQRDSPSVVVKM